MTTKPLIALGLWFAAIMMPQPAWADDEMRRIKVTGMGEAKAVPDIAHLSIGVETEASQPSQALAENASRMQAVMARLMETGVAEKDLQTSQLSIWPVYADRQQPRKIQGYRASNQLRVTLREIERIGEILDQAVADGANTISGPGFSVANPKPLHLEARDAAVKDAIAKAERYAAAAGVTLGEVIRIDEGGAAPVISRQMRAEAMATSTPIAAGETTISAQITMIFAIP